MRSPTARDNIEKWLSPQDRSPRRRADSTGASPVTPYRSAGTSSAGEGLGADARTSSRFTDPGVETPNFPSTSTSSTPQSSSRALSAAFADLNPGANVSTASSRSAPQSPHSPANRRWMGSIDKLPISSSAGGVPGLASTGVSGASGSGLGGGMNNTSSTPPPRHSSSFSAFSSGGNGFSAFASAAHSSGISGLSARTASGYQSPRKYGQAPETIHPTGGASSSAGGTSAVAAENEKLYEAYNELHSLAQIFRKPFDAPAILIVGHQTDGKSALVEALMGFQFNHVGGGTKTRRPITLQMTYNPHRIEPRCFLVLDKELGREEPKSLAQLRAYIERENDRLEAEGGTFSEREIVLRVEYKYCPNLTIIDTPGLISAAPGNSHSILQDQAATVEALVVAKMQQREFVILCLEDSNDWNNATTRKVVMMVDPDLSRTILVSTKLDTKIPQFSRAADVEMFLNPQLPGVSSARIGNKPFFTSVPSGRVGAGRDCVFSSDDNFREAVLTRETMDVAALEAKMGRPLTEDERSRIGVSKLRLFLEQLLQHRYLESVPFIVPLLDSELKSIQAKLAAIRSQLRTLSDKELKEKSRDFRDKFMTQLTLLLRGTVAAPPETFGETLEDERARGGAFIGEGGMQLPWRNMPNATMRLYGGAQYHRAMAEFRFVTGAVGCPSISREEIVNSCGVEDIHDGTNYYRTACVIAVKKAWDVFEPYLRQLGFRLAHIVRRLFPICIFLLKKEKESMLQHQLFIDHVASSFHNFVDSTETSCIDKCIEDLTSTTRFVSWTLHQKNRNALRSFLESSMSVVQSPLLPAMSEEDYNRGGGGARPPLMENLPGSAAPSGLVKLLGGHMSGGSNGSTQDNPEGNGRGGRPERSPAPGGGGSPDGHNGAAGEDGAPSRLSDILEGSLWTRKLAPSSEELVNALVTRIFHGVRDHFVLSAELKFNCFFLMPLLDKYPARLREDLEQVAGGDTEAVFDITRTRRQLEREETDLEDELSRMQSLQVKFAGIHRSLSVAPVLPKV